MLGPQAEIEIRLWCDEFARMRQTPEWTDAAMDAADDLLHRYRARYGLPQPAAPPAVWYYEPPFAKDGKSYRCWVAGWGLNRTTVVAELYWYDDDWRMQIVGSRGQYLLAGRRVCPIAKPQEPTT